MNPIVCRACGTRFLTSRFTEEQCQALSELYSYEQSTAELLMLHRVDAFYQRHPQAVDKIKPHFLEVMDSDDPDVQEQMFSGKPFDEIELPEQPLVVVPRTAEDAEVIDYLRHHHFDLAARLASLKGYAGLGREHIPVVYCPHCHTGELYVPEECWWEFEIESNDSTTFYWPDWHSFDDGGVLHVKTTGYIGSSHWTGETAIRPTEPQFTFWKWFVAQPEHHRLIQDDEFERIRAEWTQAATQGN